MKIPKVSVKIDKCWVQRDEDYHDFDSVQSNLRAVGIKASYEEVGSDYDYYAVFWVGAKNKMVKDMIKSERVKFDN